MHLYSSIYTYNDAYFYRYKKTKFGPLNMDKKPPCTTKAIFKKYTQSYILANIKRHQLIIWNELI